MVSGGAETTNSTIRFADNSSVEMRPLGVRDGRLLAALATQLSAESEFRRFLSGGKSLHSQWVARLVNADQVDSLVDGAIATNEFGSNLVAVAESIRSPVSSDRAEFALLAADAWQNLGLGTLLARHLATRAYRSGVRFWEAVMLAANHPMASVLVSVGPKVEEYSDMGLVTVTHELLPTAEG
jgi:acetyltransferase